MQFPTFATTLLLPLLAAASPILLQERANVPFCYLTPEISCSNICTNVNCDLGQCYPAGFPPLITCWTYGQNVGGNNIWYGINGFQESYISASYMSFRCTGYKSLPQCDHSSAPQPQPTFS